MGQPEYCEIGRAKQHTGQISSHNLRMPALTKLANPYAADQHLFGAAVQSNKVYPRRLRSPPTTGIASRINTSWQGR